MTNIPSSPPGLARQLQNGDALRSPDGGVQQGSRNNTPRTSISIPIPKEIDHLTLVISSTIDKLAPVERQYLRPIIIVMCVEIALLKSIGQPTKDVFSAIFFTALLGGLAWPVWSILRRVQGQLEDLSGKIDALQQSIKRLESTPVVHSSIEYIPVPPVFNDPTVSTGEDSTKTNVHPIIEPVGTEPQIHPELPMTTDKPPDHPYELPIPQPDKTSAGIENRPPSVPPTASGSRYGADVTPEGTGNIVGVSGIASGSAERPAVIPESASSHWLPALREIKQLIALFTEGRFEKTSHPDQSEPSNRVQLRRCAMRLLMASASLFPADFVSPVGFLGPSENTLYYPTGDLQRDRIVAFTTAVDCLDHMEVHHHGNDDVRIATTLFELAQALSDLGLHKYALDTSGFALDTLEHASVATRNSPYHVALILSLRANILCELKQNDEAIDAAHRAVSLFKDHRDSQATPGSELAFALLNYAVLLNSIGLKDESAAVAFELLGEVDESQPDMKEVSALCNLCLSNMSFGTDDGMNLSTIEETIERTRASSDALSEMVLSCALLYKSKILSSRGQNEDAISSSAEAITLLRRMTATRPIFSLFLAHTLDNHAHQLSEANRIGVSYSIRYDAVQLWQTLKDSAPGPITRPLAWSLFELAKFRHVGGHRNTLPEELRIAECAVDTFRGVIPLDVAGLADALYLLADRMLELDSNDEAAAYAEESIHYFQEATAEDQKYALDLINSLSLASSCLAYTERYEDALEYAKQAVEIQRMRKGAEDKHYDARLRRLLIQVVRRSAEMNKEHEALPLFEELQALDPSGEQSGGLLPQDNEEFKKLTSHWMDADTSAPRPNISFTSSAPAASRFTLRVENGKWTEVALPPEVRDSTAQDAKGKAKEGSPPFDLSGRDTNGHTSGGSGASASGPVLGTMGGTMGI